MEESTVLYSSEGNFMLELQNYYLKQPFRRTSGHKHHFLEISCVKSGKGAYYVDDRVYEFAAGDVFVFNNIEAHDIDIIGDQELINMVIHFEPQFIWNEGGNMFDYRYLSIFFNRNDSFKNRLRGDMEATKNIFKLLLQVEKEFLERPEGYELMVKVRLLEILVKIIRDFEYVEEAAEPEDRSDPQIGVIKRLLKYIDFNMDNDIRLQDLSEIAHMNPSYLSTLFKRYNGIAPIEYISRKRIHRAEQYLKGSNKSITEIAGLCGFNNAANFNKTFKKYTGITPTDYRNNKGAV